MTRPAIVIGVGGTGQWVLTFLKKELLEIGHGVMPKEVKLISFDTTSQATATTGQGSGREEDKGIRAGAVELTLGKEFIPIGDQVGPLINEIAQGRHPQLQWFPAQTFQSKLPPAAFNTKEGSGQIRQMGRISIFNDLSAVNKSKILAHLGAAIQDLKGTVTKDVQMEILIVGSLAGGTGAGMLVDIALLVRAQANQLVGGNHVVRGFFVLPKAFTSGGLGESRDMLARSFAAWRELDRFMIVSKRFGPRQMIYHETNKDLRIALDRRAYDVSYMIDPARNTENSLESVKPEEGLFPAISQCLSAFLDSKAGKEYTEFVTTNLAGKLAQLPRKPYHSAIGSYTLKVPIYYAEEKFSHQLALDVLKEFLKPEINEKGRVTRVSEMYNKEANQGQVGRPAVLKFMASSALNLAGVEIPNTKFLPLVADIREHEAQRENSIVQQAARGGLTMGNSRYLLALTDVSQDEDGKLILRNITDELQRPIWKDVAPSQDAGDTPAAAFSRIKNKVPQVRQEHYGIDTAAGERLRGKYGTALDQAQAAQVARYRKLLRAWTLHMLNGESADPVVARGGKIGYVRAFYSELAETFNYFVGFLNKVRQTRNEELRLAARTQEGARRSLMEYDRLRGKKGWFTFWDDFTHPDAHRAQRNYLLAEQRDIDVRKDDILLDVLAETAVQMKAVAENSLAEVDNWIAHLATGDQKIKGLYQEAIDSLANVNVNHELDKRLDKISKLIGEHEYQSIPKNISDAIKCLVWDVEEVPDSMKIGCGVQITPEDPAQKAVFKPFRRSEENPSKYNLDMILELAQKPYAVLKQDRPLAREIQKVFPTGKALAENVVNLAEPFYLTSTSREGPQVVACYTRVASRLDEDTITYFDGFNAEMKLRRPDIKPGFLALVDSEDLYKMTMVRSDDLVPSTDFQMWHACREAYIQQVTDPNRGIPAEQLHIFPAEINACYYEKEMPILLSKNYRTLHPEVVALLEDREKFRMFFLAYALGFLKKDDNKGEPYWAYKLPNDRDALFVTKPSTGLDTVQEDIFQVIHNFVMEGCDQRTGMGESRFVDWEKLVDAIRTAQRDLGRTKVTRLYQQQIDDPKGLIKLIRADVEIRRSQISDPELRKNIGQEHDDLADVATVIYLKAIKSAQAMENPSK